MPRLPARFLLPSRHHFTTTARSLRPSFVQPSPPRLPPAEQEEYERLQRASTGAFSTPRTPSSPTLPDTESSLSSSSIKRTPPQINQSPQSTATDDAPLKARVNATGDGEELHPDIRRGAKPEFEGDVNPKTGEVGGPKNEPLRWGSTGDRGDWSYNGRVTDF